MHQPDTDYSSTTINHLPPHLQHLILALAAAPLTTCKASAAIPSDASLTAQWLLVKRKHPLRAAVKHQLWGACGRLLGTHRYRPKHKELCYALQMAAMHGSAGTVESLLPWFCKQAHQRCGLCESLYFTLLQAIKEGRAQAVSLLAQHPVITAHRARYAICEAALFGQVEALQLLITTRPDATAPGLGGSPMYRAALHGQVPAMQLLVQHGADVHNSRGTPWSSESINARSLPSMEYLPIRAAASNGHLEAVRWLHEQGVTDVEVGEAWQAAADQGHVPTVRYLLRECGANVSLYGPHALRTAVERRNTDMVCFLLEAGTPTDWGLYFHAEPYLRHLKPEQLNDILQAATQHGHTQFAERLTRLIASHPPGRVQGLQAGTSP